MAEHHERYKNHDITVSRDHSWDDWYIIVTGPDGRHCYDGWWTGSGHKSVAEAVTEAKDGAMIDSEDTTP
jgi:hypothetical protein